MRNPVTTAAPSERFTYQIVFQTSCIAYQPTATAAMTDDTPVPFDLPSVRCKKLTVDFEGGNQSSDGGLLLLRQAERGLGVCGRLADAMPDDRDASRIRHDVFEMVMARVSAIACGHKDAIDLDRLRHGRVEDWRACLALSFASVTPSRPCHVSSPRHVERSVRISRTALSCLLHLKGYGAYRAGATFGMHHRTL
jgi:hypothetical protein